MSQLNSWALNANISKTVKATEFRFHMHCSTHSPDMTHYVFENEVWHYRYQVTWRPKDSLGGDMYSQEHLVTNGKSQPLTKVAC